MGRAGRMHVAASRVAWSAVVRGRWPCGPEGSGRPERLTDSHGHRAEDPRTPGKLADTASPRVARCGACHAPSPHGHQPPPERGLLRQPAELHAFALGPAGQWSVSPRSHGNARMPCGVAAHSAVTKAFGLCRGSPSSPSHEGSGAIHRGPLLRASRPPFIRPLPVAGACPRCGPGMRRG